MYCERCGFVLDENNRCPRCGAEFSQGKGAAPVRQPLAPQATVPALQCGGGKRQEKEHGPLSVLSVISLIFSAVGVIALSLAFAIYNFYDLTGEGWIIWFYLFAFLPAAVMAVIAFVQCRCKNRSGVSLAVAAFALAACAPIAAGIGQAFFLLLIAIIDAFGGFMPSY